MSNKGTYTEVDQRVVELRSDGEVDRAEIEAHLDASDPLDRRAGLRALAVTTTGESGDEDADIPSLAPYLRDPDSSVRYDAVRFAGEVIRERGDDFGADDALRERLDDDSNRVAEKALDVLTDLARQDVDAARPATAAVADFLDSDRSEVRRLAVRFLVVVARERPGERAIPLGTLAELVGDTYEAPDFQGEQWQTAMNDTTTRRDLVNHSHEERERHMTLREFAAEILVTVARERPEDLRAHEETLRDQLRSEEPHVRENALRVYTVLGDDDPAVVAAVTDEILACLDEESPSLRAAAVKPLGVVASSSPEAVVPGLRDRVGPLSDLLDSEDPHVRATALGLLSYVADREPEAVEPFESGIADRLDDGEGVVRANAAWALGALGTDAATAVLRDRRAEETDAEVRTAIDDALAGGDADATSGE
ncbi:MAG: HEAT repeat domain-containing protein [Halosimplex sp.]